MDCDISEYTIRIMTENDLNAALEVWASNGYYEFESIMRIFMECDRNAFYVAVRNIDQKIIGVCVSPVTSHSTGFFGIYCVLKEYKRKGIGMKLFNSCLKHIGERNAGLFAVEDMEQKYEKLGFRVKNGLALVVIKGVPQNLEELRNKVDKSLKIIEFRADRNQEFLNKIILYDTKVNNYNREQLITLTLQNEEQLTLLAVNSENEVLGFGCIKANCNEQKMIGPVYADNDSIAEALIIRLMTEFRLTNENYFCLFTLNSSIGCRKLCEKLQMKERAKLNLLYTKFFPPINYQSIYCVHSPCFSL